VSTPTLTVYGTHWCPDCRRSKQFLGEQQIPYRWVDLDLNPEAEQLVIEMNQGKRLIPTIVFGDGSFLAEPSNTDLAVKLGLKTVASRRHYQLIIVGGGPAGLTAALYTAREGIDTLLMESASFGGQIAATEQLDNFPGFPEGITGLEFAGRLRLQALRFGVEILEAQEAVALQRRDAYLTIRTGDSLVYSAQAVLLTTGGKYKRLDVPGELEKLRLINTGSGAEEDMAVDGAFIFIGLTPHTTFLRDSSLRLDPGGFVITGHELLHGADRPPGYEDRDPLLLETSLPGVFAAGDVRRGSTKQAATAAGEGASAALEIREQLKLK
jgi:thioredoxin reductase (NADPH)